jgi:hypothetical protein
LIASEECDEDDEDEDDDDGDNEMGLEMRR